VCFGARFPEIGCFEINGTKKRRYMTLLMVKSTQTCARIQKINANMLGHDEKDTDTT
jgi:hypothetical protein